MLVPPRFLQGWTSLISNLNDLVPRCSKGILPDPRLELVAPAADLSRGRRGEGAEGPGGLWRSD